MAELSDSQPVCKVSIPGTHDTMTAHGFIDSANEYEYTTQVATLQQQMEEGLRYFDIRLAFNVVNGDSILQAAHRTALIPVTAHEEIKLMADYLKLHPTEFFIMKIQRDDSPNDVTEAQKTNSPRAWSRLVHEMIDYGRSLNSNLWADFRKDITVGEMRGKILLISRTAYDEPVCGAFTNWGDEGTADYLVADINKECTLTIAPTPLAATAYQGSEHPQATRLFCQDYYNTIGTRIEAKQNALKAMYDATAAIPADDYTWVINHASGFGTPMMNIEGYAENASVINTLFCNILSNSTSPTGIVAMDFTATDTFNFKPSAASPSAAAFTRNVMGKSLTEAIIKQNFKTADKQ